MSKQKYFYAVVEYCENGLFSAFVYRFHESQNLANDKILRKAKSFTLISTATRAKEIAQAYNHTYRARNVYMYQMY